MTAAPAGPATRLVVRSVAVPDPGPLLDLLPGDGPLAWLCEGEGLVGWGAAARLDTGGPQRFADAARWWDATRSGAVVHDEVGVPGSGLVAFGSFAFAEDPGQSVLVVPEVVVGRRAGACWVTALGAGTPAGRPRLQPAPPPRAPRGLAFTGGALDDAAWSAAVAEVVRRIGTGDLEKVVLARDVFAQATDPVDVRWPLARLAEAYPTCWTFSVDGLFGATPELLVRRERGQVAARVLAGTARSAGDVRADSAQAVALAGSTKDLAEHAYAVRSAAAGLAPHCRTLQVPAAPYVLRLRNVMHLASDVTGMATGTATALELAAALHPTAAVGGTPTAAALDAIAELEGMDRGRYAGPVGWLDATGNGEWGIALRCGQLAGSRIRLFAGCGVVAGSDPADEVAEAAAKLAPVMDALRS